MPWEHTGSTTRSSTTTWPKGCSCHVHTRIQLVLALNTLIPASRIDSQFNNLFSSNKWDMSLGVCPCYMGMSGHHLELREGNSLGSFFPCSPGCLLSWRVCSLPPTQDLKVTPCEGWTAPWCLQLSSTRFSISLNFSCSSQLNQKYSEGHELLSTDLM